jgi:endonuclease/exonuclease/phosphatase family metal-dependent hydrolase
VSAPPVEPSVVRVASYNVHGARGRDGRRDVERIAAVIVEIGADVVGLQEVDSRHDPGERDSQLRALARATGMQAVAGPTLFAPGGEFGNAVLTRLPLRTAHHCDLSVRGREPRGAVEVVLDVAHGEAPLALRVAVTHLEPRGADRRWQAVRLVTWLGERGADLSVLLGDFNEWRPTSAVIRTLLGDGVMGAPRSFPARAPLLALDRVFVQAPAKLRSVAVHTTPLARVASDHLPVVAMVAVV